MTMRGMSRRSFLQLPLFAFCSALRSEEHHFQYERVIGTSLDLVVWTPYSRVAGLVCQTVLEEIDRLASILDTRDRNSEISLLENSNATQNSSCEVTEILRAYDYWERRTGGVLS